MAISSTSVNVITAEFQSSAANTYQTTGITLVANRPVYISVNTHRAASATQTVTASGPSGAPQVWTETTARTYATIATPRARVTVFCAVPSVTCTGVITFSMTSTHDKAAFIVAQFTDLVTTSSEGGSTFINMDSTAVNTTAIQTLTFDVAPSTGNATIAALGTNTNIDFTPADTLIADPTVGTTAPRHALFWSVAGDQTLNGTTTGNVHYGMIGHHLVAAASTGGGATVSRTPRLALLGVA